MRLDSAAARLATTVALSQTYLDLNRAIALADIAQQSLVQRRAFWTSLASALGAASIPYKSSFVKPNRRCRRPSLHDCEAEAAREVAAHRLAALVGER